MSNPLGLTEDDFIHLCTNSAQWAEETADWAPHIRDGRFEGDGRAGNQPSQHWRMAYWVGTEYPAVVLARAFLASRGFECQTVVDAAGGEWVILTDYDHWADQR